MCTYHTWFQADEDVYILQCTECNTFQLRVRNTAFMFDPAEYKCFCERVSGAYEKIKSGKNDGPIIMPTFDGGMDLLLKTDQLISLHILLDMANTEMRTAKMASLF
jgi:hypothetical protein